MKPNEIISYIIEGKFKILKSIGKGAFGEIFSAKDIKK